MSSKTAVFLEITGDKALAKKLASLDKKMESRGASAAVSKGITVIAKKARQLAPTKVQKRSIGTRNKKVKGQPEAKVGVNLGKKGAKRKPQAVPLTASKGRMRFRKKIGGKFAFIKEPTKQQLRTGVLPGSDFVTQATVAAWADAKAAMVKSVREFLAKNGAKVS